MSKYRSTKKGTINIRKGQEFQYQLFMGIPDQRHSLQEGEECNIWLAEMVGRGAWGTWHGLKGSWFAKVVKTTAKTITFEIYVDMGATVVQEFRKSSEHLFRVARLVQPEKLSHEDKMKLLDKLVEEDA